MTSSSKIFLILMFGTTFLSQGQSFYGYNSSKYAGIQSNMFNPALAVQSGYLIDINLASANVSLGSDYFGIDFSDISNFTDRFDIGDTDTFPKTSNNFFVNTDILGPSILFNINQKHSIGLNTRIRGILNINNIPGQLYEELSNDFDETQDFSASINDLNAVLHSWAEIGATYAFVAYQTDKRTLKLGTTIKYLQGAGGVFVNADEIDASFHENASLLSSTGTLSYGSTQGFNDSEISFDNLNSGLGFDIGAVYEIKKDSLSDYTLRIGASITDIGNITYEEAEIDRFNVSGTVSTDDFENEDSIQDILDVNYAADFSIGEAKIKLPTALRFFADYNVKSKFFLSLESTYSLNSAEKEQSNRLLNYATLTPRLEGRQLALFSPLSVIEHIGFSWGAGAKLGPLTIGSNNLFTNLASSSSKGVDAFIGLKVPIYKSRNRK